MTLYGIEHIIPCLLACLAGGFAIGYWWRIGDGK